MLAEQIKSRGSALVSEVNGLFFLPNPNFALTHPGVFIFVIDNETWVLDLANGNGSISRGAPASEIDDSVTITVGADDFVELMKGNLDPQGAWAAGAFPLNLIATTHTSRFFVTY